jgi:hypothetical protein
MERFLKDGFTLVKMRGGRAVGRSQFASVVIKIGLYERLPTTNTGMHETLPELYISKVV